MGGAWNTEDKFGFGGGSSGDVATATSVPSSGPVTSTLAPATNALHALVDPKGSAIFWVTLAAGLGLAMVSGQLALSAKLKTRAGK